MMDAESIRVWALDAGFGECAFCSAAPFEAARRLVDAQPPLAERRQLRFEPAADDAWMKSLMVLLWPYAQAEEPREGEVFVDSYYAASNAAYHAARELEQRLAAAGVKAKANVSYPAREAALRAGLGVIGQSGMLITPRYGTRVVIILVALDVIPPRPDEKAASDYVCLRCGRCAKACPSGAIDAQGMVHPERCMRNFMMEGIIVPEHLRGRMGMRMLGCDICQRVCPMQPVQRLNIMQQPLLLSAFVTDDEQRFTQSVRALADQIGRNAARPQRIRAQVALLAGNSGDRSYLPVLRIWAQSPFETVACHARWAVDRLDGCKRLQPSE